jgi:hypothetical protein
MSDTLTRDMTVAARALMIYSAELVDHVKKAPPEALAPLIREELPLRGDDGEEDAWEPDASGWTL